MNATAKQYVTTKEPGFIWKVLVKMMHGVHISDRDKYIYGQSEMLIKIMSYKDITADGIFEFDDEGHMIAFEALRYGEFDGIDQLKPWRIEMKNVKDFSGFKLPTEGKVIWKLEDGDYSWYQFVVNHVVFNERVN
jgi:hypothetical protein